MKKFTACCVDVKTHMEMILAEVSYNSACWYLESQGIKTEKVISDYKTSRYVFVTDRGVFLYDETRGILVRD